MSDESQNQETFNDEEIEDSFEGFSIDEGIEARFNVLQVQIEQFKISYRAHIETRKEFLRWVDQD